MPDVVWYSDLNDLDQVQTGHEYLQYQMLIQFQILVLETSWSGYHRMMLQDCHLYIYADVLLFYYSIKNIQKSFIGLENKHYLVIIYARRIKLAISYS